jgi:hypothetical protein
MRGERINRPYRSKRQGWAAQASRKATPGKPRPAEFTKPVGLGRRARPTLSSPAGGFLPKVTTFHDEPLTAIRRKSGTATVKTAEGL